MGGIELVVVVVGGWGWRGGLGMLGLVLLLGGRMAMGWGRGIEGWKWDEREGDVLTRKGGGMGDWGLGALVVCED